MLKAKYIEKCEEVLKSLNLWDVKDSHPMSLSGGQKQRVAIASAILSGKELIIFDEPTSGLDGYHMNEVGMLINSLREMNKVILFITHDEELAAKWCDRIIFLQEEQNEIE